MSYQEQDQHVSHKDVLDGLVSACQKEFDVIQPDKTIRKELGLDYVSMWWKLHKVNSPVFGRYAKILTDLENKAVECFNHMSLEKAKVFADQILRVVLAHKRSIDAKSSETRIDEHNKEQCLLDTLADTSTKSTRIVNLKDEARSSILAGIGIGKKED